MREVKYRGYDVEDKQWRYGYYFLKTDAILCPIFSSDEEYNKAKKTTNTI